MNSSPPCRSFARARLSLALVMAILAFGDVMVRAQDVPVDSSLYPSGLSVPSEYRLGLGFEHLLSLYDWQANLTMARPISPDHLTGFDLRLTADSRLQQETDLLTTSVTGLATARRALDPSGLLSPFLTLYGTSYATATPSGALPPPSLIRRQVDGFAVAGAGTHIPTTSFSVSAGAGVARQSQPYTSATGLTSTYGSIVLASLDSGIERIGDSTLLFAEGGVDERYFKDRSQRYSNDRLAVRTFSLFGEGHNVAALSAALARRDFFYTIDSTSSPAKQERRELSLDLLDSLRAPLFGPRLSGLVAIELQPRSVTRRSDVAPNLLVQTSSSGLSTLLVPNDVSSVRLSALAAFDLLPKRSSVSNLSAHGELRYEEHSEDVRLVSSEFGPNDGAAVRKFTSALEQASFSSRVTSTALSLSYAASARDTASISATTRLLNYDTPSEDNHDDHDELVTGLVAGYAHRFTPRLHTAFELRGTRSHLVYLKSDRSSQNNVTQVLSFSSTASYLAGAWQSTLHSEVFANFTVLDYLDSLPILQNVGSYVIRGLTMHDTTRVAIGALSTALISAIEVMADLRISERGAYNQSAFSEHRTTRVTEITTTAVAALASIVGEAPWTLKAGVRGFFLVREGEVTATLLTGESFGELEKQTRIGPYAQLELLRANGVGPALVGSVWYSVLRDVQSSSGTTYLTPKLESRLEVRWVL